jgi:hypothetical protein
MWVNELEQLLSGHFVVQVCDHWKCGEIDIRGSDNGHHPVPLNNRISVKNIKVDIKGEE